MARRRTTGPVGHSERDLTPELAQTLAPFMEAGRRGLDRANWRVGMDAADLVAPIVLAVIAEVNRRVDEVHGKLHERALAARGLMVVPVELLNALTDDEECSFDHHGGCQTHGFLSLEPGERCPHDEARELLAAATIHHNKEDQNRHA